MLETFQVLSTDTHQSRISIVKSASYEWPGYTLGRVHSELWIDVSEGLNVEETWFVHVRYVNVQG